MVISIASQKGGTGKTTTSISVAAALARRGKKVLLIDIDSQANSSKVLLKNYIKIPVEQTIHDTILERRPIPLHKTELENLTISPSHILLSNTDVELTTAIDHREARLKTELDKIRDNYDYIIIDCPPALSWLTINGFTASDNIIVIVSPGYFELDSIVQISKTIENVKEFFNNKLQPVNYLFTMSDPTINSQTSLKLLRQSYTKQVYTTVIPRNTDIRDAHFNKQVIFEYNSKAPAALAYNTFVEEAFLNGKET